MIHSFWPSSALARAFVEAWTIFFLLSTHCGQVNAKAAGRMYSCHIHKGLEGIRWALILPPILIR